MPDVDLLTAHAESQPSKPAVIADSPGNGVVRWTYAELEAQANRLANALAGLGVRPGDRVLWCGPNSPQVVAVMHATRKLGAIAVGLNYRLTPTEASYITRHSEASAAYVDVGYANLIGDRDAWPSTLRHVVAFGGPPPAGMLNGDDLAAEASAQPPADVATRAETAATMIYTSGTTGKPKGALRRRHDETSTLALINLIGFRPDDVYLTSGPLYHSGPGAFMLLAQAMGQTVVVQRAFEPRDWLRLVNDYRVSSTFSAPTPIRMVCGLPTEVKARYDRSSMKRMLANAAPWSFALKQAYLADFPADSLWELYGSTELGVNCALGPKDQLRKPGSCGKPTPGTEVLLIGEDGREVTGTGPDHTGQLYVRSATVFDAYFKQPDSYDAARLGDFHTVGDIAYRDEQGYYYICDRASDMIITAGMNVYPAEVEAALEAHPGIFDVAVFGIPSEEWGEAVHATVVPVPGTSLTAEEIASFARGRLASYKVPRSVAFASQLPRTGSGKLLKRQLRAPYWQAEQRLVQ